MTAPLAMHAPGPRDPQSNLRLNQAGRCTWHWDQRLMNDADHSHRTDPAFFERTLAQHRGPPIPVRGGRGDLVSEVGAGRFRQTFPQASAASRPKSWRRSWRRQPTRHPPMENAHREPQILHSQ